MKQSLAFFIAFSFLITGFAIQPCFAQDASELRAMVEELRKDYEVKIMDLEKKISHLENKQDEKVEQKVAQLKDQIRDEMKNSAIDVEYVGRHNAPVGDGGLLIKNPSGFGNVSLGGYFDMEYLDREKEDSTFRQHRFVLNIAAQPNEKIRFNSEIEIEYGGPNVPNADGEIKIEQAYADYLINDMINFRAGALLVPFGRFNLYHDSDLQDLTDRPILARDVIPTTWTEAGAGFFGSFDPRIGSYEDLTINYEMYVVNGLDGGFSDTGLSGGRSSLKTDDNGNKAIVSRLAFSPATGQELAVSGYLGEYGKPSDDISGIGLDTFNTLGPLELITEYAYFGLEEDNSTSDRANYFEGAYVQLNYHFWFQRLNNTFLGRGFEDPTFTLVGRYDWARIHDDSDAAAGLNQETRSTIGLNYRPIESCALKIEYQWNDTKNEVLEAGDHDAIVASVALGF